MFDHCPQPDPIPAPIPLNHLEQLTLMDVTRPILGSFERSAHGLRDFLQRIRFRTGVAFSLRTKLQRNSSFSPEQLVSLIPSPVESLACIAPVDGVQKADVDIQFTGSDFLLRMQGGPEYRPIFSAEVGGLPEQVAREWVVEWLRQPSTTPMDLRLYFGSSESGFSLEDVFSFQLWESVVELTLTGNPQTPPEAGRDLLRLLSTPCMSEDEIMVMPFPKLQHLHISSVPKIKGKEMLAMVQSRFAPPGSTEAGSHSTVPVPLTIHCGNGMGDWLNRYHDRLIAVPGVDGIREGPLHPAPWLARSSSPGSPEPEWPPPYDFGSSVGH
ncbi:hypothetical protein FRC01_001206 [Tulasnella sp. 417]|nr:hypothetical protein FRC01_001206 [Tulasnella sp. 417]